MSGYLDALLKSKEPLELHERNDLAGWLKVLRDDCKVFGAAAEDRVRMAQIRHWLGCKPGDPDPAPQQSGDGK